MSRSWHSQVLAAIAAVAAQAIPTSAFQLSEHVIRPNPIESPVVRAQVEIYVGRPYRPYYAPYSGYRSYYYGDGPYYRPRPYYAPPPPDVTYYESRPYVVRPAPRSGGDPDAIARCASQFRSFNANTGTYVTYEGEERLCPYLR